MPQDHILCRGHTSWQQVCAERADCDALLCLQAHALPARGNDAAHFSLKAWGISRYQQFVSGGLHAPQSVALLSKFAFHHPSKAMPPGIIETPPCKFAFKFCVFLLI